MNPWLVVILIVWRGLLLPAVVAGYHGGTWNPIARWLRWRQARRKRRWADTYLIASREELDRLFGN